MVTNLRHMGAVLLRSGNVLRLNRLLCAIAFETIRVDFLLSESRADQNQSQKARFANILHKTSTHGPPFPQGMLPLSEVSYAPEFGARLLPVRRGYYGAGK
jgi:hypothetical protein